MYAILYFYNSHGGLKTRHEVTKYIQSYSALYTFIIIIIIYYRQEKYEPIGRREAKMRWENQWYRGGSSRDDAAALFNRPEGFRPPLTKAGAFIELRIL